MIRLDDTTQTKLCSKTKDIYWGLHETTWKQKFPVSVINKSGYIYVCVCVCVCVYLFIM